MRCLLSADPDQLPLAGYDFFADFLALSDYESRRSTDPSVFAMTRAQDWSREQPRAVEEARLAMWRLGTTWWNMDATEFIPTWYLRATYKYYAVVF
mmetsp:Transcript_18956/g.31417  ORF Transcript_18956/g.31417 Transcript_18956/m.31417 type:complete len:96 (-) Transcript_18956:166-453(-)|eukprot:CAMPEP_0119011138 /NCGR_PEP_ID=MMETSP1176-20130426/5478_1 /TAXON_ID=265551 /ORGANISM="Synedropsis recta cf, Strain CCMP1620" /LENGTH=95 /DNA_ID=CAMNT_0006963915 /DNA_START=937 /DNA_END=1227 /DNA_ORIENTATION=-